MTDIQIVIISACPDGWEVNLDMSKCYYYIKVPVTWNEAYERCTALDPDRMATLTSVRSQAENDFVFSLIPINYGYSPWIGGTDEDEEGVWR